MEEDSDFLSRGRAVVLAGYMAHLGKIKPEEVYDTVKRLSIEFMGDSADISFERLCADLSFNKTVLTRFSTSGISSQDSDELFAASLKYMDRHSNEPPEGGYWGIGRVQADVEKKGGNLRSLVDALLN